MSLGVIRSRLAMNAVLDPNGNCPSVNDMLITRFYDRLTSSPASSKRYTPVVDMLPEPMRRYLQKVMSRSKALRWTLTDMENILPIKTCDAYLLTIVPILTVAESQILLTTSWWCCRCNTRTWICLSSSITCSMIVKCIQTSVLTGW